MAHSPGEPQSIQSGHTLACHVAGSTIKVQFTLSSLAFDPSGQLWVLWMVGWNMAIAIFLEVLFKLSQALLPGCGVRVPDEANLFKLDDTAGSHGCDFVLFHELVLIALALHPTRQSLVLFKAVRDKTMAMLFFEL